MNSLLSVINKYITSICMALVSALVLILFIQVIFRYFLNSSLTWPDELSRFILVWITFLGASVATWHKGHLIIDFLIKKVPVRYSNYVALVIQLIICMFLLIAVIASFKAINVSFGMALISLPLSWGHAFISFPVGIGLCFLYNINYLFNMRDE